MKFCNSVQIIKRHGIYLVGWVGHLTEEKVSVIKKLHSLKNVLGSMFNVNMKVQDYAAIIDCH